MRAAARLAVLALCSAAITAGRADDAIPVALDAGEARNLCAIAPCPAREFRCDDPSVARIENGPDGAVLRGVAPGTTLCAATPTTGPRRILRVTVRGPSPSGAAPAR